MPSSFINISLPSFLIIFSCNFIEISHIISNENSNSKFKILFFNINNNIPRYCFKWYSYLYNIFYNFITKIIIRRINCCK